MTIDETIGPRIAAGLLPTKPNDMHRMFSYRIGFIYFGFVSLGYKVVPYLFIKVGSDGPYISESNMPTLWPRFFKFAAMLIAIVLLPTPPLQLETAIIFLILLKLADLVPLYF